MIFQRSPGVRDEWAKDGCYVHSILFEAAKRDMNLVVTPDRINETFYPDLVGHGFMGSDCYVKMPSEIFDYFGLDVIYLGKFGPERVCGDNEFEINLWHYAPKDWYHFVSGDGFGVTTFDPWGISTTASHGHLKSKRIFRLI